MSGSPQRAPRGWGRDPGSVPWIGFPVGHAVSGALLTVFGYFVMLSPSKISRCTVTAIKEKKMPINSLASSLKLPVLAASIASLIALAGCEMPGEVRRTTTFDVTQAEAEDIAEALQNDGRVVLRGHVVFQTDSATLSPEGMAAATRIAGAMQQNPAMNVAVVGHTDGTGPFRHNLNLSERRAQSMVDAIIANGVAVDRLAPVGVGPLAPVAADDTEEGRQQNRRVEIVVAG
jgi:outer membrane protein OmpA-like peptidoglycan-associated protein